MVKIRYGIGAIALAFLASATAQTAPVTVTYPDAMACGSGNARPDHDTALREQVAQTADGAIGYYRFGQGSPLVMITGYRAALSEWNTYFLAALAKKHEVIVFDNRGVGRSTADIANYRVDNLARDTVGLINALGYHSVSVLGWSMGGMIAQRVALDQPQLVKQLVLLSTEPPGRASVPLSSPVEDVLSGRGDSSFAGVMEVLFPGDVVQRAEHCFRGDMFRPHDYHPGKIPPAVTAAQEGLLRDWSGDEPSFDQLRRLSVPTLVLTGTEDAVLSSRNSAVLAATIPHAKLVQVERGGHAMMYQFPLRLADEVDAFIGN